MMTTLRGTILASSFGIENELVMLALADEFGSNDHGTVGSSYFLQEQQWREDHRLHVKIDRAKPIIRARKTKHDADILVQKLASYRELRNLLAHYPSWLEPVNDGEHTVALKLFIADRTHLWEVDHEQAGEWLSLLRSVHIAIETIRREIVGAPPLLPDGSPPPPPTS